MRRPPHVCLIDDVLAVLDPVQALTPEEAVAQDFDGLVVDNDPAAARSTARRTEDLAEAHTKLSSSPLVLEHLANTIWLLNDTTRDASDLMRMVLSAAPRCFDTDRLINAALYSVPSMAPADHREDVDSREHLYYLRFVGSRLEEEGPMHLMAAPLAVQLSLMDGSRAEEVVAEMPALAADGGVAGNATTLVKSRHRLFLPLRSSRSPRTCGVLEVGLADGSELRQEERAVLSKLTSAFGAAAARSEMQAGWEASERAGAVRLKEQETRIAELEGTLAHKEQLLRASAALTAASELAVAASDKGLAALASHLASLTSAEMVTIFSVSRGGPDSALVAEYNEGFSALNEALGPNATRGTEGAASPADFLPHQGLARRAVRERASVLCADLDAEPAFDGATETRVGFRSTCVLVLPVLHADAVIGVLQLTNKKVHSGTGSAAGDRDPTAQALFGTDTTPAGVSAKPSGFTQEDESSARSLLAVAALVILQRQQATPHHAEETPLPESASPAQTEAAPTEASAPSAQAQPPPPPQLPPQPAGFQAAKRGAALQAGAVASRPSAATRSAAAAADLSAAPAPAAISALTVPPPTLEADSSLLELVVTTSSELGAAHNLRGLLFTALRQITRLVPTNHASIFITGEDDGSMLRVSLVQNEMGQAVPGELAVARVADVRIGIVGNVLARNKLMRVVDTSAEETFDPATDCAPGYVVRAVLCAPIEGSFARVRGAVQLCNGVGHAATAVNAAARTFSNVDERAIAVFVRILASPLERLLAVEGFSR